MSTSNVIIDLSHNSANANLQQAQAAGIVGVIHKATQGVAFVDPTYAARRQAAANAGLLWGAYHFGTAADPVAQAKFFLRGASPAAKDLIVLDFEANPGNPANTMSLDQAREFIAALRDAQQTTPGLTWTLWQYTDGHHGNAPFQVDGVGPCDRDQYQGTVDDLRARWVTGSLT